MSKIFGYTKMGGKDWFPSAAYSDTEIEAIKDPEGGGEVSLPTAIPSPFARIDLVKTAFKNINKTPELKAYSTKEQIVLASKSDEKLVSESLDLAEMLFNYNSLREKINIIIWDKEAELKKIDGASSEHRRFLETLKLYFEQDKESYNFDLLKRFYLIEYDYKIIGCTSPVTMFYSTGNDLSHARINLAGNDTLFDESYSPLYERDQEFQRYLYLLFAANPALSSKMTDFAEYLEKNKKILEAKKPKFHAEIMDLDPEDYSRMYAELSTGTVNSPVDVLGVGLRKRRLEDITQYISRNSDFRILASKGAGDMPPLVLQNGFAKNWLYVQDPWNEDPVPFQESAAMDRRRLPGKNITYPYLTISDFLEPYLVRLVYPVNKEKFFDGGLVIDSEKDDDSKGYLLPLKRQFFDYFSAADLLTSGLNKPSIKLVQGVAKAVKVILNIPVSREGESITFERMYFESANNKISKADEEANKGVIIEQQVGITLFPFIKTNIPNINAFYRVQLVDRDFSNLVKDNNYSLNFYSDNSPNPVEVKGNQARIRSIKGHNESDATSQYYVLENEFDFIQVKSNYATGIVIPKWPLFLPGQEEFSFAIDFGTTNTHIEYKVRNRIGPFDITQPKEIQIATLFDPEKTTTAFGGTSATAIRELVDHEFIPHMLGRDPRNSKYNYKFPQRTVLSESNGLDIEKQPIALADFNIPFTYEKKKEIGRIQSNLKWAKKGGGNEERIIAFFEEIMMLLRNKVLLNNGSLSKTKIFWFYPSSMTTGRVGTLRNEWNRLFKKYFNVEHETVGITESMAPFFFFKEDFALEGGGSFKPVVSIDIGGGTSDIVVFQQDKPILLTSFKFAANTIFGDGFSEYGTNSNGFVNKYYPRFKTLLEKNQLGELSDVLSSIKEKCKNEDVNAFFFSIEDNPKIDDKQLFSYNAILSKDENLKIVFLYFYSAIIYHIAALMRSKNIGFPKNLVFSGTGSKILRIVTPDFKILSNLSRLIFEEVYGEKFTEGLSVKTEINTPKEVTCKGGLLANSDDLERIEIHKIKSILTCLENNGNQEAAEGDTPDESEPRMENLRYSDLDDSIKEKTAAFVEKFNSFFIKLDSQFRFTEYFNISENSLRIFKEEFNKDLRDYLEAGLAFSKKLDDVTDAETEIGETLFFYPIIGTINRVARILSEQRDNE